MLRLLRWSTLMFVGLAASACATMNVSSHVERGLDFTQYRTWAWGQADSLPASDARFDDAFVRDHLMGAVEREMSRRGLAAPDNGAPDLLVHYHANVTPRIEEHHGTPDTGACYDGDCSVRVIEREQGTILVDVLDARSGRLVWRGWAQMQMDGVFGHADRLADRLGTAVTAMFKRFPRGL